MNAIVWFPLAVKPDGIRAVGKPTTKPIYQEDVVWLAECDLDDLLAKYETVGLEGAKEVLRAMGETFAAKS